MRAKLLATIALLAIAGCLDSPTDKHPAPSENPTPPDDGMNVTRIWTMRVNLTTEGASEIAGYSLHPGVPPLDGVHEPTNFNCARLGVKGVRLVSVKATANWTADGPEENLLLYHYMKERDGPFHDGQDHRGPSPLTHEADLGGRIRSTEWLTVGVHPATGLPYWYGMVDRVEVDITIESLGDVAPNVEEFHFCSPMQNQPI